MQVKWQVYDPDTLFEHVHRIEYVILAFLCRYLGMFIQSMDTLFGHVSTRAGSNYTKSLQLQLQLL